jgi:hypothetical protein
MLIVMTPITINNHYASYVLFKHIYMIVFPKVKIKRHFY